ncbi:MAG: hypothetical protein ACI4W6_07915 [Acutalibacteraceae bacterium]
MSETNNNEFLIYKDRPFVRSGNTIYYGNLCDDHYLVLKILSSKEENGLKVADRVVVNLIKNDPALKPADRIIHKIEKNDLYSAMLIGRSWLEQAQASK